MSYLKPSPDAVQTTAVLGVRSIVAAATLVLQHERVVGESSDRVRRPLMQQPVVGDGPGAEDGAAAAAQRRPRPGLRAASSCCRAARPERHQRARQRPRQWSDDVERVSARAPHLVTAHHSSL